jgi:hypothetical protein
MQYFTLDVKHKVSDASKPEVPPRIKSNIFVIYDEIIEAGLVTAYKYLAENLTEAKITGIKEKDIVAHIIKPDEVQSDDDIIFNTRVHFVAVDDKGGKEKIHVEYYYVQAKSMGEVETIMKEHLKASMMPFKIWSATPTKIVTVIT